MNANPVFVRAVRGPIILITVGVLFAIDHAGGFPFERTWPAIIIVIGLMKLLERAAQPPIDTAAYPAGPTWTPQYPGGYQPPPGPPQPPPPPVDPNLGGPRP